MEQTLPSIALREQAAGSVPNVSLEDGISMCRHMLQDEVLVPLQSILVFQLAHPRVEVCPRPQQAPEVRVVEHSMLLGVVVKIVSNITTVTSVLTHCSPLCLSFFKPRVLSLCWRRHDHHLR